MAKTALDTLRAAKAYWQTVINTANAAMVEIDAALAYVPTESDTLELFNQMASAASAIEKGPAAGATGP